MKVDTLAGNKTNTHVYVREKYEITFISWQDNCNNLLSINGDQNVCQIKIS